MSKHQFKSETIQDPAMLVKYLEAVRNGFEKGSLVLAQGDDEFVLTPKGLITFIVSGKVKDDERKLQITFRWKESDESGRKQEPLLIKG